MRLQDFWVAAFPLALLTGCLFSSGEQPELTSEQGSVDSYADKNDLIMSRAAAAVDVAREANDEGKPDLVEAELDVAASYLPKPSSEDLAYARKRAAANDPNVYQKAKETADRHQRELDAAWSAVEREKQRAKDALEAQQRKHEAERKMLITYAVVGVGSLGVLAGLAMLVLGFKKLNALSSVGVGLAVIAAATVFDAPWFGWVAGGTILLAVIETWRRLSPGRTQGNAGS